MLPLFIVSALIYLNKLQNILARKAHRAGAGAGVGQSLPGWLGAVPRTWATTAAREETKRSIRSNQLPLLIWECFQSIT